MVTVALPTILLVSWQILTTPGGAYAGSIPSPGDTLLGFSGWVYTSKRTLFLNDFNGSWLTHVWASTERVLFGFVIASVLGAVLGVVVGTYHRAELALDPTIQALRPIPVTAWVPFSLIVFGITEASAIALIAVAAFFPVFVNTAAGAQRTPTLLVRAARMLGSSQWFVLRHVVLPSTLPSLFVGLRLAIGMSWVAVIVSEMVGVKSGLGYMLWQSYYWGRIDILISAMLTVAILGFISDRVVYLTGRRLLRWAYV